MDHFDALVFWANERIPVIVVKGGIPGDRQRFNLARELGHILLDLSDNVDEEKAAHRFAGAFLVPRQKAIEELGEHRQRLSVQELHILKHKYGLSMQAWIY
ncbi:MAG: ImmA/IrrE family metallo-endopeptidase [Anaerolineales bacterium]|nr:ImmA/IrrE family metallo-endopeptidase [Anaerolineales bacterium]